MILGEYYISVIICHQTSNTLLQKSCKSLVVKYNCYHYPQLEKCYMVNNRLRIRVSGVSTRKLQNHMMIYSHPSTTPSHPFPPTSLLLTSLPPSLPLDEDEEMTLICTSTGYNINNTRWNYVHLITVHRSKDRI